MRKTKKYSQNASSKPVKDTEHSSRTHLRRQGSNNGESNEQVLEANEISRPTKVRSRRKMHLKKSQKENAFSEQFNSLTASVHDVAFTPKVKFHELLYIMVDFNGLTFNCVCDICGRKNSLLAYLIHNYDNGASMSGSTVQLIILGLLKESLLSISIMLDWDMFLC